MTDEPTLIGADTTVAATVTDTISGGLDTIIDATPDPEVVPSTAGSVPPSTGDCNTPAITSTPGGSATNAETTVAGSESTSAEEAGTTTAGPTPTEALANLNSGSASAVDLITVIGTHTTLLQAVSQFAHNLICQLSTLVIDVENYLPETVQAKRFAPESTEGVVRPQGLTNGDTICGHSDTIEAGS